MAISASNTPASKNFASTLLPRSGVMTTLLAMPPSATTQKWVEVMARTPTHIVLTVCLNYQYPYRA
jgi:hypothetical protein